MTTGLCDNDYTFGPGASCRVLDFTVLFSNVFLAFVPALSLLILASARIPRLLRKQRKLLPLSKVPLGGRLLLASRAALASCLVGSNVAVWVTWERAEELRGAWSGWAASASSAFGALAVLAVVMLENFRNSRPSQLPALYLLVNALFLGSRIRTVALLSGNTASPLIPLSTTLAITVALFLSLQFSTRSSLVDGDQIPPSGTAGLVERYFIAWVLPLLWRGYRKPLTMDDLGAIDRDLYSLATWNAFKPAWVLEEARQRAGKTRHPLFWACMRAFRAKLLAPVLPSLIYTVASMGRPLIVLQTINFVQSFSSSQPDEVANGWGLVGATFLVYAVYALALAMAHVSIQRSSLALRGAFMEALYRKSLVLRVETVREMGAAKASNLMSVDVTNIIRQVQAIHTAWTAILQTGLGLYIIWTQIGLSFLASVVGAIVFFASLPLLTRGVGNTRSEWGARTDRRIKYISSVLRHIKAVKMSAYESCVQAKGDSLRNAELVALVAWIKEILKVSIATNWLGNFLSLVTVITFTVVSLYSSEDGGNSVTTAKIFTVVSTISIISGPLLMLGQSLGAIVSAWASIKRIEEFLLQDEKVERDTSALPPVNDSSLALYGLAVDGEVRIALRSASFGVKDKITILKELDVELVKPGLWMIIGRVGCGKSTLLQSLLGETDLISGDCSVQLGSVGFCSQDAWLRNNDSIKDNITFMHPFEKQWYWTVMKAVGLDVDLKVIAEGDDCVVSNLSGGQKQRVALARAVYGRFDTYLLDDVFSALDADTEAKVFEALFGSRGLLIEKCVILATNQIYRLAHASYITVLQEGRPVEQGEYEELNGLDGPMAQLVREFAAGRKRKNSGTKDEVEAGDALSETGHESKGDRALDKQREQEVSKQGTVAWGTYLLYLKGMGLTQAAIWMILVVVTAAIQTCTSIYLQAWTTTLAGAPNSRYGAFLGGYTGMEVGYLVCFTIAIYNGFLYAHPAASRRLHQWQLAGLLGTSLDFFESRGVGQMVNRFNSDLNTVDFLLPNAAVNFAFTATLVLGSMTLIIVAGRYMAAVIAGTLAVMVLLQRFYVRAGRELRRFDLTSKSPIYTLFSETVDADGLRTIRAMRAQDTCRALMTERATISQYPAWLIMAIQKWLELALNMCVLLVNTLLVAIVVVNRHSTSAGILAVALTGAATMNDQIGHVVVQWTEVEICITSVERVQEYIELPPQASPPPQSRASLTSSKLQNGEDPKFAWLSSGGIQFSHVSARYKPDLPPALNDVTFVVRPGQRVGICGRSGSGKSTLLGALWRLIPLDGGDGCGIFVDGEDIRDLNLEEYRGAMSIIPQDPLLLELSLRENLDPEGLHTDADIWSALEKSQLKAHVESFPGKLDELIEGDGGIFSRGQRQLLALARAILRQRKILALDEATSSIDVETDAAIQQTIRAAFNDCTVLTIAHRISTIIDYDLIVVMEGGAVVEIGSPWTLLAKQQGHFWRLAMENGALGGRGGSGSASGLDAIDEITPVRE